jgi:hypothetical protein
MAFGQPLVAGDQPPLNLDAILGGPAVKQGVGFVNLPQSPMAQATAKPKVNWLGVLADALAGAAGRQGPYAEMMMKEREHQQVLDDYNRKRTDENADWQTHYDYERNHPKDTAGTEFERGLQAVGAVPGTDAYTQHWKDRLDAIEHPPYFYTDPATGQPMMIPRGRAPGTPAPQGVTFTPVDDGGPSPGGSGGFR